MLGATVRDGVLQHARPSRRARPRVVGAELPHLGGCAALRGALSRVPGLGPPGARGRRQPRLAARRRLARGADPLRGGRGRARRAGGHLPPAGAPRSGRSAMSRRWCSGTSAWPPTDPLGRHARRVPSHRAPFPCSDPLAGASASSGGCAHVGVARSATTLPCARRATKRAATPLARTTGPRTTGGTRATTERHQLGNARAGRALDRPARRPAALPRRRPRNRQPAAEDAPRAGRLPRLLRRRLPERPGPLAGELLLAQGHGNRAGHHLRRAAGGCSNSGPASRWRGRWRGATPARSGATSTRSTCGCRCACCSCCRSSNGAGRSRCATSTCWRCSRSRSRWRTSTTARSTNPCRSPTRR